MENQIITKIKAELAAFEAKKQAFISELRKEFPTMFKDIFATAPNLKSVSWTQYTPYFNDGDTCYFSAHTDDLEINGVSEYNDDEDNEEHLYDTIKQHVHGVLKTEEDVETNKLLADKIGYSWYANKKIGEEGLFPNPDYNEPLANALSSISEVLSSIPDEFLQDLFGDHARVTIYADGTIDTEDYDHD